MAANKTVKIRKFSRPQIWFHWIYGISWILLVLTGIIFLFRADPKAAASGFGAMLHGDVGAWARFVHRVAAIGLMVSPLVWLFGDVKSLMGDLKELLTMGKDDWKYLAIAPLHYTVGKPALPPQGKYNGGHKMNFWIVVLTFVGFVVSGLYMWFFREGVQAGKETFRLMLLIHSISFWIGLAMGVVHIYLTMIHPFTSQAFESMVGGYVKLGYAKAEHKLWVDEQIASGKADMIEEPAKS